MLVLCIRVLCDAAVFDASAMKWILNEPTPFMRCAHSGVALDWGVKGEWMEGMEA